MKSYKMTKSRTFIFVGMLVVSLLFAIEVNAKSDKKPWLNVPIDTIENNTVSVPSSGVSNPAGKYPPGLNKK